MLKKGFLHRNIGIYSVRMLDPPVSMKPFEARPIEEHASQLFLQGELNKYTRLLESAIGRAGFSDSCHGFVMPCDTAARLEGSFTSRDTRDRSVGIPGRARRL